MNVFLFAFIKNLIDDNFFPCSYEYSYDLMNRFTCLVMKHFYWLLVTAQSLLKNNDWKIKKVLLRGVACNALNVGLCSLVVWPLYQLWFCLIWRFFYFPILKKKNHIWRHWHLIFNTSGSSHNVVYPVILLIGLQTDKVWAFQNRKKQFLDYGTIPQLRIVNIHCIERKLVFERFLSVLDPL